VHQITTVTLTKVILGIDKLKAFFENSVKFNTNKSAQVHQFASFLLLI